jgi:hypothetical protein
MTAAICMPWIAPAPGLHILELTGAAREIIR